MNRQLSVDELAVLGDVYVPVMTRREKLLRFAQVVRQSQHNFVIFHLLEYMDDYNLSKISHPCSAFSMATSDSVLSSAGLKSDDALSAKRFFELTTSQLHEFSCDCGGQISNDEMANRIERLANLG